MKIDHEKIEEYLLGQLSGEESAAFKKEMNANKTLSDEVDLHRRMIQGIHASGIVDFMEMVQSVDESFEQKGFFADEEEKEIISGIEASGKIAFKELISRVDQELANDDFFDKPADTKKRDNARIISLNIRQAIAIAASLLVIVTASILLWPGKTDHSQLYSQSFEPPAETLSAQIASEKSEIGFAAGNAESLDSLNVVIDLYSQRSYTEFLSNSEALLTDAALTHYRDDILLYQAISFMSLREFDPALEKLNAIATDSADKNWYSALSLIQLERISEAKPLLEKLSQQENPFRTNAERLLKKL